MNDNFVKYIVARLSERAFEAKEESEEKKGNDFYDGIKLAYFEVMDILKSEFDANGYDLKEYGLENIDKELMK